MGQIMSTSFFDIFSLKKLQKKPVGGQPSQSFEVVKTNRYGKRQNRKLCFANDGVRNMSGSSVKWYLGPNEIVGLHRDKKSPTSFTLTAVQRFHFDAKSPDQLAQIFDAVTEFGVGSEELSRMVAEKAVCSFFRCQDV
jgi:hypothetical protein